LTGEGKQAIGLGVDASGGPVIDPTANVIALTEAANQRQDDLRQLNDRRIDAEIRVLTAKLDGIEARMVLRSEFAKELRDSERMRIDAIRQVDVLAVGRTAEQQLAAVQTLAATTTAAAETIRASVSSTATALATQLANTVTGLTERISALEKSSYEGAGKGAGAKNTVTYAIIGVGLLVSLITIGSVVIAIAFAIRR